MSLRSNVQELLKQLFPYLQKCQQFANEPESAGKAPPIVVGLSGLQGSGKSTWASMIVEVLHEDYGKAAMTISLDDFYHTHEKLLEIKEDDPKNSLLRTRGQPGTHDEFLAAEFFDQLRTRRQGIKIPQFDKSLHGGEGDRIPPSQWQLVPDDVDIIIFEGWCVGFQPLRPLEVEAKLAACIGHANKNDSITRPTVTINEYPLEHLLAINENLDRYCQSFMGTKHFDLLVHLDTDKLENVYTWRLQQEHASIQARGCGLSDEEVNSFVKGYMPSYELYLDGLRRGMFLQEGEALTKKYQFQVILGTDREVLDIFQLQ